MVTDDMLRRIMPNLPPKKRAEYLPHLQRAMDEFGINTPLREAAFLAQIAHESAEFRFMAEIWGPTEAQRRYEPESDLAQRLGNSQVGDGERFKGRGPIQITGRANYQKYSQLLGIDVVGNPSLAATPELTFRIAGLYWQRNGLNELADQEQFKTITKRINGGFNGLEDRLRFYDMARTVLGVAAVRGIRSVPDRGDDSSIPRFTRGLDSSGEITPSAAERNIASVPQNGTSIEKATAGGKKSGVKKDTKPVRKKTVVARAAKKSTQHGAKKVSAKNVEKRRAKKPVKGRSKGR
jgi:putative chitinase